MKLKRRIFSRRRHNNLCATPKREVPMRILLLALVKHEWNNLPVPLKASVAHTNGQTMDGWHPIAEETMPATFAPKRHPALAVLPKASAMHVPAVAPVQTHLPIR